MFVDDELDPYADSRTCVEPDPRAVVAEPEDHILVIDDDSSQVEVLTHSLKSLGYRVSVAGNREAGMRQAKADRPDLILLDVCLPDGDGLEICSELNDRPDTADIPVIVVSGADRPDVVRNARAAGCHYYVRKPYDPNALLVLAQNAISESRDWSS